MTAMCRSATADLIAKKFHWAEACLTIKVDFASQDEVHHEDKATKAESEAMRRKASTPL